MSDKVARANKLSEADKVAREDKLEKKRGYIRRYNAFLEEFSRRTRNGNPFAMEYIIGDEDLMRFENDDGYGTGELFADMFYSPKQTVSGIKYMREKGVEHIIKNQVLNMFIELGVLCSKDTYKKALYHNLNVVNGYDCLMDVKVVNRHKDISVDVGVIDMVVNQQIAVMFNREDVPQMRKALETQLQNLVRSHDDNMGYILVTLSRFGNMSTNISIVSNMFNNMYIPFSNNIMAVDSSIVEETIEYIRGKAEEVAEEVGGKQSKDIYKSVLLDKLRGEGKFMADAPVKISFGDSEVGEVMADLLVEGELIVRIVAEMRNSKDGQGRDLTKYIRSNDVNYFSCGGLPVVTLVFRTIKNQNGRCVVIIY